MITNYLLIGVVFMFICDVINYKYRNHKLFQSIPELGLKERIVFILIWPVMLFVFLKAFLQEFFK